MTVFLYTIALCFALGPVVTAYLFLKRPIDLTVYIVHTDAEDEGDDGDDEDEGETTLKPETPPERQEVRLN